MTTCSGMKLATGALGLAMGLVATPALADCSGPPFYWRFQGETVDNQRDLVGDDACHFRFSAGGTNTFRSAEVAVRPKHGVLGKSNLFDFAYIPTKGYVGTDTGSIKICGTTYDKEGCSILRFTFVMHAK